MGRRLRTRIRLHHRSGLRRRWRAIKVLQARLRIAFGLREE